MRHLLVPVLAFAFLAPASAALPTGARAPDFVTKGSIGGKDFQVHLKKQLRKGPVVLYFYPKSFTQGCTLEAHGFAEAMPEFRKAGASVIGLIVTGNVGGLWIEWHYRLGQFVFTLLLFRFVWGFLGGHWSRFVNFVKIKFLYHLIQSKNFSVVCRTPAQKRDHIDKGIRKITFFPVTFGHVPSLSIFKI